MDLRTLRQFVAVAEELNFRRAAERLHMSQPPLSVAIQRLEKDMAVKLLRRDRQGVSLTEAGAVFLREARRLLAQVEQSREIVRRAGAGMLGTLRLSFFPSAAYQLVPDLLADFSESYPDVKFVLNAEVSSRQNRELLRHSIDLAIVVPPLAGADDLKLQPLRDEELVLAVPMAHPLGGQKTVDLRTLSREAFVGFHSSDGPAFETLVLSACRECGFLPRIEHSAPQMLSVLALVGAGCGIAIVPGAMQAAHIPRVRYVAVTAARAALRYPVAIAYDPSNENPVIPVFLSSVARAGRPAQRPKR